MKNVRLNLFRVTISSIRTVDLPAPFFLSVTELVSRNTATNKIFALPRYEKKKTLQT
jgi:hypothetical protein